MWAVGVTMANLFFGGGSHFGYLYFEVEVLACQRVISIEGYFIAFESHHGENRSVGFVASAKSVSHFEGDAFWKLAARNF